MNINQLSKLAEENLMKIINNELSNSRAKNTTNALAKKLAVEMSKIKYQQHIGTSEKIPFFEGKSEEK